MCTASCQAGGMATGLPDVCRMPVVPGPLIDIAPGPGTIPTAAKMLVCMTPSHNLFSRTPMTFGDDVGVGGGMVSQTFKGVATPITGSFSMLLCGAPAKRVGSVMLQNTFNIVGLESVPGQGKVWYCGP